MQQLYAATPLDASHFDVAVVRCLFMRQWSENGVLWALKYLHNRVRLMHAYAQQHGDYDEDDAAGGGARDSSAPLAKVRKRSCSVPNTPTMIAVRVFSYNENNFLYLNFNFQFLSKQIYRQELCLHWVKCVLLFSHSTYARKTCTFVGMTSK